MTLKKVNDVLNQYTTKSENNNTPTYEDTISDRPIIKSNDYRYNSKVTVCAGGLVKFRQYNESMNRKVSRSYMYLDNDENLTVVTEPLYEVNQHHNDAMGTISAEMKKVRKTRSINRGRVSSSERTENSVISTQSLTRTRNNLIELVAENRKIFKSFITLTIRDDIRDIDVANKMFNYWCIYIRSEFPEFAYIGVPEFQKRGVIHYHLLTNIKCGSDLLPYSPRFWYSDNKKDYVNCDYTKLKYWNHGYITSFNLDMADDHFNVALYITKYLYKDIDNRLWGRNKILRSNNLNKPNKYYLLNDEVYQNAIEYLKNKGYDLEEYTFSPKEKYQIEFTENTSFSISEDDISVLCDYFNGNTVLPILEPPKTIKN